MRRVFRYAIAWGAGQLTLRLALTALFFAALGAVMLLERLAGR